MARGPCTPALLSTTLAERGRMASNRAHHARANALREGVALCTRVFGVLEIGIGVGAFTLAHPSAGSGGDGGRYDQRRPQLSRRARHDPAAEVRGASSGCVCRRGGRIIALLAVAVLWLCCGCVVFSPCDPMSAPSPRTRQWQIVSYAPHHQPPSVARRR